jgi:hypothetical protein
VSEVTVKPVPAGQLPPAGNSSPGRRPLPDGARRVHMPITVCAGTLTRMDELCVQFSTTRGRLVDKLVEVLHHSYSRGKLYCIHGESCRIDRTDLPAVY